jgi:uncharacterized membrane protein
VSPTPEEIAAAQARLDEVERQIAADLERMRQIQEESNAARAEQLRKS